MIDNVPIQLLLVAETRFLDVSFTFYITASIVTLEALSRSSCISLGYLGSWDSLSALRKQVSVNDGVSFTSDWHEGELGCYI